MTIWHNDHHWTKLQRKREVDMSGFPNPHWISWQQLLFMIRLGRMHDNQLQGVKGKSRSQWPCRIKVQQTAWQSEVGTRQLTIFVALFLSNTLKSPIICSTCPQNPKQLKSSSQSVCGSHNLSRRLERTIIPFFQTLTALGASGTQSNHRISLMTSTNWYSTIATMLALPMFQTCPKQADQMRMDHAWYNRTVTEPSDYLI